jgi:hypothetical protein
MNMYNQIHTHFYKHRTAYMWGANNQRDPWIQPTR